MISRRSFVEIRKILIRELARGNKNINELARATKLNWRTTENHLIYLIGRGYVNKVIDSPYVKIFSLTKKGKKAKEFKTL